MSSEASAPPIVLVHGYGAFGAGSGREESSS